MTVSPIRNLARHLTIIVVMCVIGLCVQSVAVACPTCADGMNNDPNHANLVRGYFWSIIFMMSMPFLIFVGMCSYFYLEVRRGRARLAQGGQYVMDTASAPNA